MIKIINNDVYNFYRETKTIDNTVEIESAVFSKEYNLENKNSNFSLKTNLVKYRYTRSRHFTNNTDNIFNDNIGKTYTKSTNTDNILKTDTISTNTDNILKTDTISTNTDNILKTDTKSTNTDNILKTDTISTNTDNILKTDTKSTNTDNIFNDNIGKTYTKSNNTYNILRNDNKSINTDNIVKTYTKSTNTDNMPRKKCINFITVVFVLIARTIMCIKQLKGILNYKIDNEHYISIYNLLNLAVYNKFKVDNPAEDMYAAGYSESNKLFINLNITQNFAHIIYKARYPDHTEFNERIIRSILHELYPDNPDYCIGPTLH
uniref:Uncharacterized protein n=1 Tax=viral metagenome TaxID=1070528 RepID=A0A6C0EKQ9_9ZZZZ